MKRARRAARDAEKTLQRILCLARVAQTDRDATEVLHDVLLSADDLPASGTAIALATSKFLTTKASLADEYERLLNEAEVSATTRFRKPRKGYVWLLPTRLTQGEYPFQLLFSTEKPAPPSAVLTYITRAGS